MQKFCCNWWATSSFYFGWAWNSERYILSPSYSSVQRNARQIYNLKVKKNTEKKTPNDNHFTRNYAGAVRKEQSKTAENCLSQLNDAQPFVHEFLYQSGGQSMFVLYLEQTLSDIYHFWTDHSPLSAFPLTFDTTFKISCHRIWWMSRIVWWHSLTDRKYGSVFGTRICPEKGGRVSKEVPFSSEHIKRDSRIPFRWDRPD